MALCEMHLSMVKRGGGTVGAESFPATAKTDVPSKEEQPAQSISQGTWTGDKIISASRSVR